MTGYELPRNRIGEFYERMFGIAPKSNIVPSTITGDLPINHVDRYMAEKNLTIDNCKILINDFSECILSNKPLSIETVLRSLEVLSKINQHYKALHPENNVTKTTEISRLIRVSRDVVDKKRAMSIEDMEDTTNIVVDYLNEEMGFEK